MTAPIAPTWTFDGGPTETGARMRTRADGARLGFDHGYGDGYDWIQDAVAVGWWAIANWGLDGWDLGDWPYVVAAGHRAGDSYSLIVRVEGDLSLYEDLSRDDWIARIDKLALYHWRHRGVPTEAEIAAGPPERFSGPFSWDRLARESYARTTLRILLGWPS